MVQKEYLHYLHWMEIKFEIRTKLVDSLLGSGDIS